MNQLKAKNNPKDLPADKTNQKHITPNISTQKFFFLKPSSLSDIVDKSLPTLPKKISKKTNFLLNSDRKRKNSMQEGSFLFEDEPSKILDPEDNHPRNVFSSMQQKLNRKRIKTVENPNQYESIIAGLSTINNQITNTSQTSQEKSHNTNHHKKVQNWRKYRQIRTQGNDPKDLYFTGIKKKNSNSKLSKLTQANIEIHDNTLELLEKRWSDDEKKILDARNFSFSNEKQKWQNELDEEGNLLINTPVILQEHGAYDKSPTYKFIRYQVKYFHVMIIQKKFPFSFKLDNPLCAADISVSFKYHEPTKKNREMQFTYRKFCIYQKVGKGNKLFIAVKPIVNFESSITIKFAGTTLNNKITEYVAGFSGKDWHQSNEIISAKYKEHLKFTPSFHENQSAYELSIGDNSPQKEKREKIEENNMVIAKNYKQYNKHMRSEVVIQTKIKNLNAMIRRKAQERDFNTHKLLDTRKLREYDKVYNECFKRVLVTQWLVILKTHLGLAAMYKHMNKIIESKKNENILKTSRMIISNILTAKFLNKVSSSPNYINFRISRDSIELFSFQNQKKIKKKAYKAVQSLTNDIIRIQILKRQIEVFYSLAIMIKKKFHKHVLNKRFALESNLENMNNEILYMANVSNYFSKLKVKGKLNKRLGLIKPELKTKIMNYYFDYTLLKYIEDKCSDYLKRDNFKYRMDFDVQKAVVEQNEYFELIKKAELDSHDGKWENYYKKKLMKDKKAGNSKLSDQSDNSAHNKHDRASTVSVSSNKNTLRMRSETSHFGQSNRLISTPFQKDFSRASTRPPSLRKQSTFLVKKQSTFLSKKRSILLQPNSERAIAVNMTSSDKKTKSIISNACQLLHEIRLSKFDYIIPKNIMRNLLQIISEIYVNQEDLQKCKNLNSHQKNKKKKVNFVQKDDKLVGYKDSVAGDLGGLTKTREETDDVKFYMQPNVLINPFVMQDDEKTTYSNSDISVE